MSSPPYRRVDLRRLPAVSRGTFPDSGESTDATKGQGGASISVRWSIVLLSALLCSGHMIIATLAQHIHGVLIISTLISMGAFAVLMGCVLVANPILWLLFRGRLLRPLNRPELTCIFASMLVTSGIATFGLASNVVPLVAAPWNPEWNTRQQGWDQHVLPHLNESLYISASEDLPLERRQKNLESIRQFREGLAPVDHEGQVLLRPGEDAPWAERLSYWQAVAAQLPWDVWVVPLALWLLFAGACYAMFYCLTYVVLRSWVYREQLIFPLAQLPKQLLPDGEDGRRLPVALRHPGFWAAAAIVAGIYSWNAAVNAEFIPQLGAIGLGVDHQTMTPLLSGTAYEAWVGGVFNLRFIVIFTVIGLAFLLPTAISFSMWFYYLVILGMLLLAVWAGFGQTGSDFPTSFYGINNFITAQGGGALLMFGGICLGRALADWWRMNQGQSRARWIRTSGPIVGLILSLATIVGWLVWNDLPVLWALTVTALLVLFTLGLMRVVAEGGIHLMSIHTGPFHLYNALGLSHFLKPPAIVPLMPIYSILFLDLKTFLAPNLPNAGKLDVDTNTSRRKFHTALILSLIASVVVAVAFSLFLAYLIGAQQMQPWFYSQLPRHLMDEARDLATQSAGFEPSTVMYYVLGGSWFVFSLFIRQFLLWFPHPIGYVMFANSHLNVLWFGFFLGWVAKMVVVKYGGKKTFESTRPIFIGLIMGELMAIFLWTLAGLWLDFNPGITDNRGSA